MTAINLQSIRIDGGTQSRVRLDVATIDDYAQVLRDGGELPAVVVFFDGTDHWLADGFHRLHAYRNNRCASIPADVRTGTQRDAILHSFGANGAHGLRRTNEDKRKAVSLMLADAEWSRWSSREIAKTCLVSHDFVARLKSSLSSDDREKTATYTTKHGTQATMKTGGIGKKATEKPMSDAVSRPNESEPNTTPGPSDELAESRHTIVSLFNEVEELKAMLAVEHMDASEDAKTEAAQIIADLRAQVRTLEAENAALRISRDKFQSEVHELTRQIGMNRRELDRARAA